MSEGETGEDDYQDHFDHAAEPGDDSNAPPPERLFRPSLKRLQPALIPGYVQNWLIQTAEAREKGEDPKEIAAQVLTEACHAYYRMHAPPLPFELTKVFAIASDAEEGPTLEWLAEMVKGNPDDGAADLILEPCITNGSYAWFFFMAAHRSGFEAFEAWLASEWGVKQSALKRAGWPDNLVVQMPKGTWPRDPRLLPGNPITQQPFNDMLTDSRKQRQAIP